MLQMSPQKGCVVPTLRGWADDQRVLPSSSERILPQARNFYQPAGMQSGNLQPTSCRSNRAVHNDAVTRRISRSMKECGCVASQTSGWAYLQKPLAVQLMRPVISGGKGSSKCVAVVAALSPADTSCHAPASGSRDALLTLSAAPSSLSMSVVAAALPGDFRVPGTSICDASAACCCFESPAFSDCCSASMLAAGVCFSSSLGCSLVSSALLSGVSKAASTASGRGGASNTRAAASDAVNGAAGRCVCKLAGSTRAQGLLPPSPF